ncbi:ABC transporter ATP-binding protein [Seohaeicola nanhaiensis]|uniref:ABC transporter ATP-binding protein n=1 Tax=Seohaeicola nanhaiensis TaxID=1387282 RepID=A0ABV9KNJ7_9RHOB
MSNQMTEPSEVLMSVRDLKVWYGGKGALFGNPDWVRAVDGVTLDILKGETLGLVGESGCGKSSLGRALIRLERPHSGSILFGGEDLAQVSPSRLRTLRRDMQMVFQDPMSSLDPRMTIRRIIAEGLVIAGVGRDERNVRVEELIQIVGLRKEHLDRYPHEFSGGQRQRIGIARALALRPKLVVADEPVSALDVSVQSQVLNLMKDLQDEFGLTYLFIAHDLGVVEYISDRVGVMYLGRLVELADAEDLYARPMMPYTQALLSAIPDGEAATGRSRIILKGDVPSPRNPPSGCPFRTRCWRAEARCAAEVPQLQEVAPRHWAACHFPG